MNVEEHWFEKGAKFAKKYFLWMQKNNEKNQKRIDKFFTVEYIENLNITGLKVEPFDILIFAYMGAFLTFVGTLFLDLVILFFYGFNISIIDPLTILLMIVVTVFLPFVILNLIANYPKTYARYIKIHSLGDIPEVLSYLVMYLKLVPNLENSVKFAASESSTSLANDLRKMLWDMEIRVYHGINDALTNFANSWGKWNDHFKRALHLIRSSIHEPEEAQRVITLNRALDVGLDGTRDMMNHFVSRLHQPTMIIYSIGIMIPLSFIAMLPATGLVGLKITIFQVFFLYDIILPLFVFLYTRRILIMRPATFNPPVIPDNHPDLVNINKRRNLIVSVICGVVVALPGIFFMSVPMFFSASESNVLLNFIIDSDGLNSYFPVTLFIIWGIAVAIMVYTLSVYRPYKKIRDDIKQMEKEFGDALYILGKRINEEKSPEESFIYTADTMGGAKIAEVFNQAGYNLMVMHTNIRDALFSPDFGSLKHVYSDRIKAIMRLFVEGIQKSQKAVSISIIRIADHLKELQQVEDRIKNMLYELTSTLRSTSAIFAPLIAGVTLAITKLITNVISSMSGKIPTQTLPYGSSSVFAGIGESFAIDNIRPEYFVLVIGIYVIELVFILTRFTNGIDDGDDKAAFMYNLGMVMPVAVMVLTITIIIGQILFSSIVKTI
ncbi:MAG: hypothetical protein QHH19_03080 [Candidatus Thermoplasmatota archaeon]|jgi:hypothetical protein|nr:hypothetical protein [Candidatus Thermoplasmatota archaeon]